MNPLICVMPFLISLMAFRHSPQLYNRYYEEYARTRDNRAGIRVIIENMFMAGLTSIVTDAFGIAIVALAPIPVLQNMAIAGAFWSIITVVVGLILTPVLLSYVPISPQFIKQMERERLTDERREGFANRFADWLGPWLPGKQSLAEVRALDMTALLLSRLDWAHRRRLDQDAPTALATPDGTRRQLDYTAGDDPVLAVPLQGSAASALPASAPTSRSTSAG